MHGSNVSVGDFEGQLNFLWKELSESFASVVTALKGAKSVKEASDAVLTKFETPKDQSAAVQNKRAGFSETYYNKYVSGSSTARYGSRTLKKGMSGQDVKNFQEDLIKVGYSLKTYGADGSFGNETETAVKKFQREHDLTVDGIAGNATFAALEKALKNAASKPIAVGDIVKFKGNKQYTSVYSTTPKSCKPGKAKVTVVFSTGKPLHPYHIIAVSGGGSNVYGWVDKGDIERA